MAASSTTTVLFTDLVRSTDLIQHLGDEDAEGLFECLAPWANHVAFNGVFVFGSVSRALGLLAAMLGSPDAAERHFTHAVEVHERLQAPALVARTLGDWARSCRAADLARADTFLDRALAAARTLGLLDVERRARELAVA